MEAVAEIVGFQEKRFDGQGGSSDVCGTAIPLEARILKVALDFDQQESRGPGKARAMESLRSQQGCYDPLVLEALERLVREDTGQTSKEVTLEGLRPGMILLNEIRNVNGVVLVGKGQEITPTLLHRLRNLSWRNSIREPIAVLAPLD
jgi:hypothetical protein